MQISAVNPSFQGSRDRVDELINLDDESIRRIAYLKTAQKANDKKHRNITNTLIAAAPVAAGLGAAVFSNGKPTKIFSKEVSGLAARAANGLKRGALWGAALGALGLVNAASSELLKASPEVRKFDREHPIISIITLLAAGVGAIALTGKVAGRLGAVEAPKFLKKATANVAKFLNTNKTLGSLKRGINNITVKTPSALKEVGEVALDLSPQVLLLGGLLHSLKHNFSVSRDYTKNYTELKEKQLNLAQARKKELELENDFFKQNEQNKEDITLIKDPLNDLPDEVVEKIEDLNTEDDD